MNWACGVTTVPERLNILPKTLKSLEEAGFSDPWLFVDGAYGVPDPYRDLASQRVSTRWPKIRVLGNWYLGLVELMVRNPLADVYAMFQDDLLACRNVRQHVDAYFLKPRPLTYLNLYSTGPNERHKDPGWYEGCLLHPNSTSRLQKGIGALGLVLPRLAVIDLLSSVDWVQKPLAASCLSWKNVDGGVVNALNRKGWREMVHAPSLLQHIGSESTLGNPGSTSVSWPGESFDALEKL
jgi:hypothetical protein